jgi:hypothetical protein
MGVLVRIPGVEIILGDEEWQRFSRRELDGPVDEMF